MHTHACTHTFALTHSHTHTPILKLISCVRPTGIGLGKYNDKRRGHFLLLFLIFDEMKKKRKNEQFFMDMNGGKEFYTFRSLDQPGVKMTVRA